MAHHHFRSPWVDNAADPSPPATPGSDEAHAADQGRRIIEFGILVVFFLLTEFSLSSPITPPPTAMAKEILAAHNRYRAEVGASPLQWSNTLAIHALEWARRLAWENAFRHDENNTNEGEN